ncbi:MAG: hypothetical protein CM15mP74_31580 [Halieaceae bacterium]|nr:MAG: hypothetical protein CM15mP74_31580 [Halieaceae bacterium]
MLDESPGDDRTALFRIDVIEIPVENPSEARIIDSPTVFADPESGALAGLWRGGDHGDDTQETSRTDECHDITVFPARIWPRGRALGTVFCLISASHARRNGSTRSATPVSPTGTQPLLTTMAPRSCLPMNGAEACATLPHL